MKIDIKNNFTHKVIFSHEQENNSIIKTLEKAIKLGISLVCADLSGADLSGANLSGANLIGVNLSKADLSKADLSRAYLNNACLSEANLTGAFLTGAKLSRADFRGADLTGDDLSGADLSRADLTGANLTGAYLFGAYLNKACLTGAILSKLGYGDATLEKGFIQILGLKWNIFIFDNHIKIGCKIFKTEEWENFSDEEISKFDLNALRFWKENKAHILLGAKIHQG